MSTRKLNTNIILYASGLLCFIPLVGYLISALFILFGLIRFKNFILVIIGIVGILFNLSFQFYMQKDLNDTIAAGAGYKEFSQKNLKQCVKVIEYFKMENGIYPDNLEQLEDSITNFTDIYRSLDTKNHRNPFVQYILKGDFYSIFSVGPDKKPHTLDDIYPEVDTTKTGFRKLN